MDDLPAFSHKRLQVPLILATDLDGTFAGGSKADRTELQEILTTRSDTLLIYITGRSLPSARTLMSELSLPVPEILVTDVGTRVVDGATLEPIEPIESVIAGLWPGGAVVRERLATLDSIVEQAVRSPYRVSYAPVAAAKLAAAALPPAALPAGSAEPGPLAAIMDSVRDRLGDLEVDLLGSAGIYLDILPPGVNKGTTLGRILHWLGRSDDRVLVAGDSLNDYSLFELGHPGVVVGNGEAALIERVGGRPQVHLATGAGAAGITEALEHFGWLSAPIPGRGPLTSGPRRDTIYGASSGPSAQRHQEEIESV